MVLHRQILFSLAIAAIAEALLMRTSAKQVPSLYTVAHRYLELVISPNFWPLMLILFCTNIVRAAGHDLALFCTNLHSICRCSLYEPVGEVLELTIATDVGKS